LLTSLRHQHTLFSGCDILPLYLNDYQLAAILTGGLQLAAILTGGLQLAAISTGGLQLAAIPNFD
jgi:hypothetical protein